MVFFRTLYSISMRYVRIVQNFSIIETNFQSDKTCHCPGIYFINEPVHEISNNVAF